ncbi:hypothetical protein F511_25534 [Dorcoceras hygrometricum]|uniref:Uncharacterized protein n=1 Tax=Dorcoceras hygrometricum TaxID=472368 RepID=A0A2Z7AEU4_9LAMI|nr:hypothetical protein F511_25534 [Dorcoceras hygrometricum]
MSLAAPSLNQGRKCNHHNTKLRKNPFHSDMIGHDDEVHPFSIYPVSNYPIDELLKYYPSCQV